MQQLNKGLIYATIEKPEIVRARMYQMERRFCTLAMKQICRCRARSKRLLNGNLTEWSHNVMKYCFYFYRLVVLIPVAADNTLYS